MNYQAKLDKIFSEYIRLRDSDSNGYIRCISCGKIVHWKNADAGHYVNRRHLALRYDEKNVNAQCRACNRFDEGNMIGYHAGLIKKYGEYVIQYLEIKKHNTAKYGKFEYQTLIKIYKQKINQLKK
ncbi:MAG: recombination protein NinG [Prevotellaceae bacterium]|jgi:uncharacterized C2H2 Zn-finger protein|nr:recombination protein NinG [Prevotellaceae bacterium]